MTVMTELGPGRVIPDGTDRETAAAILWTLHSARMSAWRLRRQVMRTDAEDSVFAFASELDSLACDAMADTFSAEPRGRMRRPGEEALSFAMRAGVDTVAIDRALRRETGLTYDSRGAQLLRSVTSRMPPESVIWP